MSDGKTMSRRRGPKESSDKEFRRVGIKLIDPDRTWFRCLTCGCRWSPNYLRGGRLPRGYWICPEHRCNA